MSYLGYRAGDADTPLGGYFNPQMAPLPGHVVAALEHGPQAEPVLLGIRARQQRFSTRATSRPRTATAFLRDGAIQVSVRTDMPGVTPAMWDWWFGWHGSDSRRYKLWHPRAHVSAQWGDDGGDGHYVGRTSLIEEYLGSTFAKVAIQFVEPAKLGLAVATGEVAVCARLGSADLPVDIGWLVHHVRPTTDGAEMRSRFWMGGPHVAVRHGNRLADSLVRPIAARQLPEPRDLLVHCAQEMNHLAGFLPELHSRFG